MKNTLKLFLTLVLLATMGLSRAQGARRGFVYEAQLMADGRVEANIPLLLRISLTDGEATLYSEIHSVRTNDMGVFQAVVGEGEGEGKLGQFAQIEWGQRRMSLRVELSRDGGTTFGPFAENEILAVPYAYYAHQAGQVTDTTTAAVRATRDLQGRDFVVTRSESGLDTLLTITADGRMGVGTTHPRGDVELGVNRRLHLSSEEWHLDKSGVITIQGTTPEAKPSLVWYDELGKPHAAITSYDRQEVDSLHNREFAIETDNGQGQMLPRITIPYNRDVTTVGIFNSNLEINTGNLIVGKPGGNVLSRSYYHGPAYYYQRFAVGDEAALIDANPFAKNSTASLQIAKTDKEASLLLRSGGQAGSHIDLLRPDHLWRIGQVDDDLVVSYNGDERLRLTSDGRVGIGTAQPQSELHLDGTLRVDAGLTTSSAAMALYFEAEDSIPAGTVVGISPAGLARPWREGDNYVGVATTTAGYLLGEKPEKVGAIFALVAVMGGVGDTLLGAVELQGAVAKLTSGQVIAYRNASGLFTLK